MATEFVTALWYAIISNTDLLCYLLVFLNMIKSASLLAMPIPIMVFLWGTMTVSRPSKTFWVTLIAYTQVVVLIKCVCQLHIVWWNADPIPPNLPLAPARIIGIEKNANYADFDLALLLVIFFHRFVQKQMGIWRSVPDDDAVDAVQRNAGGSSDADLSSRRNATAVMERQPLTAVKHRQRLAARNGGGGDANGGVESSDETLDALDDDSMEASDDQRRRDGDAGGCMQNVAALSLKKYCSSFTKFFRKLLLQVNRVTVDLYVYIFLCDFINFFVLLFGFTAFGVSSCCGTGRLMCFHRTIWNHNMMSHLFGLSHYDLLYELYLHMFKIIQIFV